ncbi:hypothetical protein PAXRUDRAFT_226903 [Paxillus rubicundulus Ve08.2h10]|uniref:DUF6593 domain-containing protein n=1 Tax=Paxillus rubicundulus Ve08.2h10 TaxID=930991 RepID=A0A0D0E748_9AGAM|nr:hypothetical protein PAXRUDRAFT_226903 [Paxillus rubicundulus Ve08.2h10]
MNCSTSTTQLHTQMAAFNFTIYFTGNDDPRDGGIVIGEDERPVYFEFETELIPPSQTRTTIYSDRQPVAAFDWGADGNSLGVVTIGDREFPMLLLVMSSPVLSARRFQAAGGGFYDWRRVSRNPNSYELYAAPNTQPIAVYHQFSQATPIGPSHGTLEYNFTDCLFLLEALLALNINRWIDWND